MAVKMRAVGRMLALAGLMLATLGLGAAPARAAYWTVPVNYYALEDIRFPLSNPVTGPQYYENVTNLSQVSETPGIYDGAGHWYEYVDDPIRGRVVQMHHFAGNGLGLSFINSNFPPGERPNLAGGSSLSVWVKADNIQEGQFLAAGGNQDAGYSLTLQDGVLVYTYWVMGAPNITAKDELHSRPLSTVAMNTGNPNYFGFTPQQKARHLISGNRANTWLLDTAAALGASDREYRWQLLESEETYDMSDALKSLNYPYAAYQIVTGDRLGDAYQVWLQDLYPHLSLKDAHKLKPAKAIQPKTPPLHDPAEADDDN